MNPLHICFHVGSITLVFRSMLEATTFIEAQSTMPAWRSQWTFTYQDDREGRVNATSKTDVNLRIFQPKD